MTKNNFKYGFFISFTKQYIIGTHALINSILTYNNKAQIILCYDQNCKSYITHIKKYLKNEDIRFIESDLKCPKLSRWGYLFKIFDDYDAVCIMDADQLVLSNWDLDFEVAIKSDMIISSRDQSERIYTNDYKNKDGTPIFSTDIYHPEFCCGAPTIIPNSAKNVIIEWEKMLSDHNEKIGDMETITLSIIKGGYSGRILSFPTEVHTNTHHTFISPKTYIQYSPIKQDDTKILTLNDHPYGIFITASHIRIKGFHGKPWEEYWTKGQLNILKQHLSISFGHKAVKNHNLSDENMVGVKLIENHLELIAKNSMNIIIGAFITFLNNRVPWDWEFTSNTIQDFLKGNWKHSKQFNKLNEHYKSKGYNNGEI